MTIVASGLLGTAGMMLHAIKINQGGALRTQAITILGDVAERLEANRPGAIAGNYNFGNTPQAAPNCTAATCAPAILATYDASQWQAMAAQLPGGDSNVTLAGSTPRTATYTITINWADRRTGNQTTYASAGNTENFSVTTTKTIYCVSGGTSPC